MATLRLEFTNDENSKLIEISSDVNNLEAVDNLITDFRSLIVREKFPTEADDNDDKGQLNFEFDGQTLMYADGEGQLNGQYGTSTDTKTTWEKVVDQEGVYQKYRELDNSRLTDEENLKTTWPFPKERPADSIYDRPAQATFRVDSDSKDEDYFSASDYRSGYYGGA